MDEQESPQPKFDKSTWQKLKKNAQERRSDFIDPKDRPSRGGRGRVLSRQDIKENMGRGSIRSVKHTGETQRGPEHHTMRRLDREFDAKNEGNEEVIQKHLNYLENNEGRFWRSVQGMEPEQIVEMAKNQNLI